MLVTFSDDWMDRTLSSTNSENRKGDRKKEAIENFKVVYVAVNESTGQKTQGCVHVSARK